MSAPRIHHLGCGTFCPHGRRVLNGHGGWLERSSIACHVLLVELADGLALVDTGLGVADLSTPGVLARGTRALLQPRVAASETAVAQIRALGSEPSDVRHIVLTHADFDHAGGLRDFPGADVHISAAELRALTDPPRRERPRYQMAAHNWAHGPRWRTHEPGGDSWFGFESARVVPGADDEVVMIPLPGHTLGHAGVAVRRKGGWLLHAGDAFFHHGELLSPPRAPAGAGWYEAFTQADGAKRRANLERLRELAAGHSDEVAVICSHDPAQLEAYASLA